MPRHRRSALLMLRLVTCMSTVKALPSRVVSGQTGTSLKPPEQARELGARTNAFNLFAPFSNVEHSKLEPTKRVSGASLVEELEETSTNSSKEAGSGDLFDELKEEISKQVFDFGKGALQQASATQSDVLETTTKLLDQAQAQVQELTKANKADLTAMAESLGNMDASIQPDALNMFQANMKAEEAEEVPLAEMNVGAGPAGPCGHSWKNIEYAGKGFDLVYSDPTVMPDPGWKLQVFDTQATRPPTNKDLVDAGKSIMDYKLDQCHPPGIEPSWFLSAAGEAQTSEIKNTMQLKEAFESFRHSESSDSEQAGGGGIFEAGAFGMSASHSSASAASNSHRTVEQYTTQQDDRFFLTTAHSTLYQALVNPYEATLSDGFKKAVWSLPTRMNTSDEIAAYHNFIYSFGTHYVARVVMGTRGLVMSRFIASTYQTLKASGFDFANAAAQSFSAKAHGTGFGDGFAISGGMGGSHSSESSNSEGNQQSLAEQFDSARAETISSFFGKSGIVDAHQNVQLNQWTSGYQREEPMPVDMTLSPLTNLLTASQGFGTDIDMKRRLLSEALAQYCSRVAPGHCEDLGPVTVYSKQVVRSAHGEVLCEEPDETLMSCSISRKTYLYQLRTPSNSHPVKSTDVDFLNECKPGEEQDDQGQAWPSSFGLPAPQDKCEHFALEDFKDARWFKQPSLWDDDSDDSQHRNGSCANGITPDEGNTADNLKAAFECFFQRYSAMPLASLGKGICREKCFNTKYQCGEDVYIGGDGKCDYDMYINNLCRERNSWGSNDKYQCADNSILSYDSKACWDVSQRNRGSKVPANATYAKKGCSLDRNYRDLEWSGAQLAGRRLCNECHHLAYGTHCPMCYYDCDPSYGRKVFGYDSALNWCDSDDDCNGGTCTGKGFKENGLSAGAKASQWLQDMKASGWFGTYGGVGTCDGMCAATIPRRPRLGL